MIKSKNIFKLFLAGIIGLSILQCRESLNSDLQLERNSMTIMVYLKSNPSYSILVNALEKTKLAEKLNLNGTITLFAPTNDAFNKFLKSKNVANISEINTEDLKSILYYHLYNKSFKSSSFTSGSLSTSTLDGGYIKMDVSQGVKNTILNGSVKIDSLDIKVTNGVVHVIDNVLESPALTLYEWLKTKPQYSIMLEAFEKTGNDTAILKKVVYDPITISSGKPLVKWRTIFIETNDVLKNAGINSFDDLARKYSTSFSTTKSYSNPADSLNLFVRYHCLEKKYFASDFKDEYVETFQKGLFLTFSIKPVLSINNHLQKDLVWNLLTGKNDTIKSYPKISLALNQSNWITKNGIVHQIDKVMSIYNAPPMKVIQNFAGSSEDRVLSLPNGETKNFSTELFQMWNNDPVAQNSVWWLKWEGAMTGIIENGAIWPVGSAFQDYCVGILNNTSPYTLEITTKPIIKGTYAVYITSRNGITPNYFVQFYMDDIKLGSLEDFSKNSDSYGHTGTINKVPRQVGVVKFTEMASHKFKVYVPNPSNSFTVWATFELWPL